ncbi:ABC-2 type transporter [Thermoplasmatales archaeon BRNA1]|nr:ABC-2 type transporter [Thermoplasmatales archaeon BRNA1]
MSFFRETYCVAWADLRFMKHNAMNIVISSLMAPILYLLAFGYGLNAGDVEIEGHMVPYLDFVIPGIIALSSLNGSYGSTATRMNVQRLYYRSFDEMMMCPLSNSAIIIGKATLGILRGMFSCMLMFIIGFALEPDFMNFTPWFVVTLVTCTFTFSLLGETCALMVSSHQGMATFGSLVITPMTFLCGTFFNVANLPEWAQAVLYALPLTEASSCFRAATLDIYAFPILQYLVIVAFGVAFFLIDLYLLKNKKV